ncbi:MAG: lysoplasmalogenase, partial [Anaeroplasmataceae bacterium]|nr:lysoplasmalogenase [Anaeroplasmataceae bacterium]
MKRNSYKIISLFVIVLCFLFDVLYIIYGSLWQKGLASGCFVVLGIILFISLGLNKKKLSFPILMLVGLTISMLADILLNIHFITGAILFAAAHICYIFSYSRVHKFHYIDFILGLCIMIPAILWLSLSSMFDYGSLLMKIVVI